MAPKRTADMQDVCRQTCVITGATSGIGFEAARQLAAVGMTAIGIEPGLIDTGLSEKNTAGLIRAYWRHLRKKGLNPPEAAAAVVRLASDPSTKIPADYWRLDRPVEPSPYARRVDAALQLWQLSERLCSTDFL